MDENFPNAKWLPLKREEVIAHIEGRGLGRPPFVATPVLWRPDLLADQVKGKLEDKLLEYYPDDVQCFEYNRPKNFGASGEYCWVDVPNADPSLNRSKDQSVGLDEDTALEWDIINQIGDNTPDPWVPDSLVQNYAQPDGRYRLIFWTRCTFERLWHFRGMENTLMDFYLEADNLKKLLAKLLKVHKRAVDRAADEYHFDGWAMTDDIGTQDRAFFSEEIFIEFIKPIYQELINYVHSKGMHFWLHTCGNIEPFIPHFIEMGLDVLHPIQKYTMDEKRIMEQYGDKICFWAGMDVQRTMPFGTTDEVREEVRFMIDNYYIPGKGRLIIAPGNRVTTMDIPYENVEAFLDESRVYGQEVAQKQAVGSHQSPFINKAKAYEKSNN